MHINIQEFNKQLREKKIYLDDEKYNTLLSQKTQLIAFSIEHKLNLDTLITDHQLSHHLKDYENKASELDIHQDPNPQVTPNVLEVFAGAGGLLLGFKKAHFNTIGAIEIDKHCCHTLTTNLPELNVIHEDIEYVCNKGIQHYINEPIDVLTGGFPCQAFSYAGKKLGILDTRGTLFYWYAQLLKQLNPKIFVAENVKGLVSHDQGKTLQTMIQIFEQYGYSVSYKVLNANDYHVAQKRQRLFIIGIRKDIYKKPFQFPKPLAYKPVLKDILTDVPDSPGKTYPEKKRKVLELVPPGGCWRDLPIDIQKEYMMKSFYLGGGKTGMARRLSWDEPSLTLTTSPDMKQTERCHPDETRPLTTREYARIQSFPDHWTFSGPITAIYKQIGNAVPVNLSYYVALAVKNYLLTYNS